ncbi:MAG: helix-turn-helix transcriptional regulator [Firmicutes bacterium]|jgi:DNA-binding helix-turn-helix protein|nr:helix-turn-helix transcriptional regulator [Clostridia bacterium]MBS5022994.1 helix-turn-helix transcriptional regulator [Bacillota bacterium]
MKEKTRFIKRLEEIMSEKGYTQQKLAELLNISQTAISNYLRGDRKPNYEMILLIGAYLDETPNELLGYDEKELRKYRKILIEERIKSSNEFKTLCEETVVRMSEEKKNSREIEREIERLFQKKYKEFLETYALQE